ncbi:BadF/BadG/BcrA/BcrD ATPase family protein [Streptomyces sp. 8K308]|uniref:BadF/BadG/BcrA/BcrD ATPase family protein n=1 Tax=Streptomyces sp. 8K308 TaxID=2530388 RepID=UPI001404A0E1|nr:BadF/BadG/BcrA/BcrD ATPase family protein [Streptomyces sp. 8K308]
MDDRDDERFWAIDAGGSSTTAALDDGSRLRRGSVNPASVGAVAAERVLRELLGEVAARLGPEGARTARGWLATAALDAGAAAADVARIATLARASGLLGPLVVSRDVLPLLLAPPLAGRGVAVVCGTGSGFLASDGSGPPVSVGGCEYLGSDEGSAFQLGLDGLRAAVRGLDGRGAPTTLGAELAAEFGSPVRELARDLAARPFPKAAVAALAPVVSRCWLAGDEVAGGVVTRALDDLVAGVRAARDLAGLRGGWPVVLNGGVFRGSPEFAETLGRRLVAELGAEAPPERVADPAGRVLAALRARPAGPPAALAGWAWTIAREAGEGVRG